MPINGLSRACSYQDISSHNEQTPGKSQFSARLNNVRSSCVNLARPLSCPPPCSLPDLKHISSVPDDIKKSPLSLANFESTFAQKAIQDLFNVGPDGKYKDLETLFRNSSNAYAKREIMAFAKVFSQLLCQSEFTDENRIALNQLAQNYNRQILRDGLGEKSGFAAWTASTNKRYAQRSKLEHQLATLADQYSTGDVLKLGAGFMAGDVMPYIQQCLEQQLGAKLNSATRQRLPELVDKAAMRAFDALRTERVKLIHQRGMGLGKLARDLDTVAALPRLLRDLLSAIAEAPKNTKPKPPQPEATVPPENKAGPHAPSSGGFTLNGGIHTDNRRIDNSQHNFNLNINVSGGSSMPTQTPLVQNLNLGHQFQSQGNQHSTSHTPDVAGGAQRDVQPQSLRLAVQLQEKARRVIDIVPTEQQADSELFTPYVSADMAKLIQSPGSGLFNAALDVATYLSDLLEVTNAAVVGNAHRTVQTPNADATDLTALSQAGVQLVKERFVTERLVTTIVPTERAESELFTPPVSSDMAKPIQSMDTGLLHGVRDVAAALSNLLDITTGALEHKLDSHVQPADVLSRDADFAQNAELKRVSNDYGRLQFRGNLYAQPSQAYLRSTGGQFNAEHELLKAVRSILEVDSNQPWSIRRDFEQLRNRLLPNNERDRILLLQAVSNEEKQQALKHDIDVLQDLLANHPGLAAGRSAVESFARTLLRETDLCQQGKQPNPLVVALLDGIAGTGEKRWFWRDDVARQQPAAVTEKVVLTTDGIHFDPAHARSFKHAK